MKAGGPSRKRKGIGIVRIFLAVSGIAAGYGFLLVHGGGAVPPAGREGRVPPLDSAKPGAVETASFGMG